MKLPLRIKVVRPAASASKKKNEKAASIEAALAWGADRAADYIRRQVFLQHPFQIRSGKAAFLWYANVEGGSIRVFNPTPYVRHLNYGWQGQQMTWLLNRTVPIDGGTVFRRVTQRALDEGKWFRPFRPPTYFVENALRALVADMEAAFPGLRFTIRLATLEGVEGPGLERLLPGDRRGLVPALVTLC